MQALEIDEARREREQQWHARVGLNFPVQNPDSLLPLPGTDSRACPVLRLSSTPRAQKAVSHFSAWREHLWGPLGKGRNVQEPWFTQAVDILASEHARVTRQEAEREQKEAKLRALAQKHNH